MSQFQPGKAKARHDKATQGKEYRVKDPDLDRDRDMAPTGNENGLEQSGQQQQRADADEDQGKRATIQTHQTRFTRGHRGDR